MGWGGVGWGNNVQLHLHTHVMLRICTFFSMLRTHVTLRFCTFFSLLHTHTHVMLRFCTFFSLLHTQPGSMKVNRQIFRYIRSFQWRWETQRDLLKTTARYIKQLSWLWRHEARKRENMCWCMWLQKLNPHFRRPLFKPKNWRFVVAKIQFCT